jgi:hypothetical protein
MSDTIKEVNLQIEEMIKKIEKIKMSIEDAFEKGIIDFDEITGDLEEIKKELQSKSVTLAAEIPRRHLLKANESLESKKFVLAGDYR